MKLTASLLASAAILLPGAPAWSAVYTIDWTGTLDDGYDLTGVFGHSSTSLIGETAHITFRVDTATPGSFHQDDVVDNVVIGNLVRGFDDAAPVTASVTVKGVTRPLITRPVYVPADPFNIFVSNEVRPTDAAAYELNPVPGLDEITEDVSQIDNIQVFDEIGNHVTNIFDNYARARGISYAADISDADVDTPPMSHVFTADDSNQYAEFRIFEYLEEDFIDGRRNRIYNNAAFGRFIPTSYTVTVGGGGSEAVPEPAAWGLMILGFGAIGAALRRRSARPQGSSGLVGAIGC